MQDGASGHSAASTQEDLRDRGITFIDWPPYSPDLNPIEILWFYIKNHIQGRYPHLEELLYETLKQAVREVWDIIGKEMLEELIQSMQARCQAVITANGMYTKY